MTADLGLDTGGLGPAANHPPDVGLQHGMIRQLAAAGAGGAEQRSLAIAGSASCRNVGLEILGIPGTVERPAGLRNLVETPDLTAEVDWKSYQVAGILGPQIGKLIADKAIRSLVFMRLPMLRNYFYSACVTFDLR
jgi:hypothetical protein